MTAFEETNILFEETAVEVIDERATAVEVYLKPVEKFLPLQIW